MPKIDLSYDRYLSPGYSSFYKIYCRRLSDEEIWNIAVSIVQDLQNGFGPPYSQMDKLLNGDSHIYACKGRFSVYLFTIDGTPTLYVQVWNSEDHHRDTEWLKEVMDKLLL